MSKLILILVFMVVFVIAISKNRTPNSLQGYLIMAMLIIAITFRDSSMADYKEYVRIFVFDVNSVEPFHEKLIYGLKSLGFQYIAYFFVIACLTVSIEWNAIKAMTGRLWALSLLTWLGTSFILNDMVTIRAGLSAAILLWIIKYRTDGELVKSIFLCICAVMCHMSAAIYIFLLILSPVKIYRKFYLLLLLGSILFPIINLSLTDFLGTMGFDLLDQKIMVYLEGEEANIFSIFQLIKVGVALILWMNVNKIQGHNRYFLLALKVYTIGCIWYFANYKIMAISWRISCLLWTADIIVYPLLVYIVSSKVKPSNKLIPACLGLVMFVANLTMKQYWNPL